MVIKAHTIALRTVFADHPRIRHSTRRVFVVSICVLFLFGIAPLCVNAAQPVKGQAEELRDTINNREREIQRIRSQRERLERQAERQNQKLKEYDVQFSRYLANLENSEERARSMEEELLDLVERKDRRNALLEVVCRLAGPQSRFKNARLREAAIHIVADLYRREIVEKPKRDELREEIEKEIAYQQRIRNHYMVNDRIRREQVEKQLATSQTQAEKNEQAEKQIAAELEELRSRLQTLDRKLARIREESRKPPTPSAPRQAPFQPGRPFSELKDKLPWPAPGTIVRGYGPFTHPTLKVKLENKGIDVAVDAGSPLRAVADGRVLYVGMLEQYGPIVALDHGDRYLTVYGNIKSQGIRVGDTVKAGDTVGVVGEKVRNDKPIYHFEIRRGDQTLDPTGWLVR